MLRGSDTYVIASHVASAAGRMGLMAGNRLSVKPHRYYRGLLARCPRPDTLTLTAPVVMPTAIESGSARPASDLCNPQLPAAPC